MSPTKRAARIALVTCSLLLLAPSVWALWPTYGGGAGDDRAVAVTTDGRGNVYVLGEFEGAATFGSATLNSEGLVDLFVAKYSPDGDLEWAVSAGGPSYDSGGDLVVDDAENVYVTGYFWDQMTFRNALYTGIGDIELPNDNNDDYPSSSRTMRRELFVAKLDATGDWAWATHAGGPGDDQGFGIDLIPGVADPNNPIPDGVVITGRASCPEFYQDISVTDTVRTDFGYQGDGGTLSSPLGDWPTCGRASVVVARLDSTGNWVWVLHGGRENDSSTREWGTHVTADAAGRVWVAGVFQDDTQFATAIPTSLTHVGSSGGGTLEFYHRGDWDTGYDGGVLEYTTDGGNWYDILAGDGDNDPATNEANTSRIFTGTYGYAVDKSENNPLWDTPYKVSCTTKPSCPDHEAFRRMWSAYTTSFGQVEVDLYDFSGQSIKFRWRMGAGEYYGGTGWWVDDIAISDGDGNVLFQDDMESGTGSWNISAPLGGTIWALATSYARSPTHSWFVPDPSDRRDHRLSMASWVSIPEALPNYFLARVGDSETEFPSWQWVHAMDATDLGSGVYRIADVQGLMTVNPQCSDGVDNDADGDTDFPDDAQCADADGTSETGVGGATPRLLVAGSVNQDGGDFGGWTLSDDGAYVARFEDNGSTAAWQWALGRDGGVGTDVTMDNEGRIYLAGYDNGEVFVNRVVENDFGTAVLGWHWAPGEEPGTDPAGSPGEDLAFGVAGHLGEVYVVGEFEDTARFGEREISPVGQKDAFIANLDGETGEWFQVDFQQWVVGDEIEPPLPPDELCLTDNVLSYPLISVSSPGAVTDYFFWSPPSANLGTDGRGHLFALQPTAATVKWKKTCELLDQRREIVVGESDWPRVQGSNDPLLCHSAEALANPDGACAQLHVAGAPADVETAVAGLSVVTTVNIYDAEGSSDGSVTIQGEHDSVFTASDPGFSTILFVESTTSRNPNEHPLYVQLVYTVPYDTTLTVDGNAIFTDNALCTIGTEITGNAFGHEEFGDKNGYVLFERSYYDGYGTSRAYARETRSGQIFPVNKVPIAGSDGQDLMAVAWYRKNQRQIAWPMVPVRYNCQWPASPDRIIIASELGSEVLGQEPLDPLVFTNMQIYVQADETKAGYNPNDEHALLSPANSASGFNALFALRDNFTQSELTQVSEPYSLLKYRDANTGDWRFRVYKVQKTGAGYDGFRYPGTAGTPVFPPYPVRLLSACDQSGAIGQPAFKDYKNQVWAKAAGTMLARYWYPLQPGFHYDLNADGTLDAGVGDCVPWLGGNSTPPVNVIYDITWPPDVPVLLVGETLLTPKRGLPDIYNQAAVEIVYDELSNATAVPDDEVDPDANMARVLDPLNPRAVYIDDLPEELATRLDPETGYAIPTGNAAGTIKLPSHIRSRVAYDILNNKLMFKGIFDESGVGDPLLLLNVMSADERKRLKKLDGGDGTEAATSEKQCLGIDEDCTWDEAIEALYRLTRNPNRLDIDLNARQCRIKALGYTGAWVDVPVDIAEQLEPEWYIECQSITDGKPDNQIWLGYQDEDADHIPERQQVVGFKPALTAGFSQGTGYLTLAFNNDLTLSPLPVSLNVIKVDCLEFTDENNQFVQSTYQGQIQIIPSDNVFDEQLTLRHSGDFGGVPQGMEFEWFYHPDEDGTPPFPVPDPDNGQMHGWLQFTDVPDPVGAIDITIEGANITTLSDNWFLTRYRYVTPPLSPVDGQPVCGGGWSRFAGQPGATPTNERAQLAEGWIKRVIDGLNPFEARVRDFHAAPTNTFASMLVQLGERYEGDIAFNPTADNLNSIGLIEAYQTVLNRGMKLSIGGTPPVTYAPANTALLLVASRIADFYALLGNEAYADAQDPMIGFGTEGGIYGTLAPTIFAFQNQLDSLLEEELVLLRGRDDRQGPVAARPVYNRLFWNFTMGEGEFAYSQAYNIGDQNFDGFIDEYDARILFPQGHGDAWGHYLTGMKVYYDLLRHPFYAWLPRPEAVLVAGAPVQVDFLDERKFATTAAAKARAGAEITDLTYRLSYVEDPAGQWQGYKDTNTDRAWGLSEWGKRAGQGAYFDWVVGNAILPDEDPDPSHVGIQQIDRTTVEELQEVVDQYLDVQQQLDEADKGLNPLGLAKGVVPFDISPGQVSFRENKTHFEQIYLRAQGALDNAVTVFNHANRLTELLRRNQDSLEDQRRNTVEQERDFKNRLIEIFGYPYDADLGPGGTYPADYDGPDVYHYMYVDQSDLTGTPENPNTVFTATYQPMPAGIDFFNFVATDHACGIPDNPGCSLAPKPTATLDVEYTVRSYRKTGSAGFPNPADAFFLIKPESWANSNRRSTGELQDALSNLLVAMSEYEQSLEAYDEHIRGLESKVKALKLKWDVRNEEFNILNNQRKEIIAYNTLISIAKGVETATKTTSTWVKSGFKDAKDCPPKNTVAGVASGGDLFAGVRCAIGLLSSTALILDVVTDLAALTQQAFGVAKEDVGMQAATELKIIGAGYELEQASWEINKIIRTEPIHRLETQQKKEIVEQMRTNYLEALTKGQRILSELVAFRKYTAGDVQEYRYQDMAFRVFRNDALQKYRAGFDLAARYAYLAAAAYDYETNLLGSESQAGQDFFTDIVRQRSLGQILGGEPVPGSRGLADPLGRMAANFTVLKTQLGFNNPQDETNRFSLRSEAFRILEDETWQDSMRNEWYVSDLWQVPEFRRYCKPFAPESDGPQPGLVIPFESTVTSSLNFFGRELGAGDSFYDASNFATKIRAVGVWFSDYDTLPLALTPRVYLVPVGADVLRTPSDSFETRDWMVVDQVLPVPFPIGELDLQDPDWIPRNDSVSGSFVKIRRYSTFRAHHDAGFYNSEETTTDSRLIGRSVWNRKWLLIIPGANLLNDPDEGLDFFIDGVPGQDLDGDGIDDGGVSDIKLFFRTYAYWGT